MEVAWAWMSGEILRKVSKEQMKVVKWIFGLLDLQTACCGVAC